jgi:hypothetical protein
MRHSRARLLGLALALGAFTSVGAHAQRATLDVYVPAPTPLDELQLSRPTDLGHLRFGAQLQLDYGLNPLV